MFTQPFAMGVLTGMIMSFILSMAFLFWCIKTEGRYKSEMQERYYD